MQARARTWMEVREFLAGALPSGIARARAMHKSHAVIRMVDFFL
jgi:hypothetical protein